MNTHSLINQFQSIYDMEADAIFRYCLVRVSDRDHARDMTQETFTRLWQNLLAQKDISKPRAYLFTIAHNLIIDWYRKKKSFSLETIMENDEGEDNEPIDSESYANQASSAEGRYLLSRVNEIGPSYRHAVYLKFVEGLSTPEIAEIIGVTPNAASVRINRGLAELRKITGYDIEGDIIGQKK